MDRASGYKGRDEVRRKSFSTLSLGLLQDAPQERNRIVRQTPRVTFDLAKLLVKLADARCGLQEMTVSSPNVIER